MANHICFAILFNGYSSKIITVSYYKYDCLEGSQVAKARVKELIRAFEVDCT